MAFGQRLRNVYKSVQVTQEEFAIKLGVSRSILAKYFSDKSKPSVDIISKLLINYPIINSHWLITGEGDMLRSTGDKGSKNIVKGDKNLTGYGINQLNGSTEELYGNVKELLAAKDREIEALKKVIETQEKLIERLTN